MLKLTCLFAAARQEPHELKVQAEMRDLLQAAFYIQSWGRHAVDIVVNSGQSANETTLMSVYRQIERRPGVLRGDVMRYHHLTAREMQMMEETLIQRNMVITQTKGRGRQYWPVGR
jgi:hypothetical protein